MTIDKVEIELLTEQYGGSWAINHTRRLLHLVEQVGEGLDYNREAVWIAAHLHDWGAYAPLTRKDVDPVERSVQVADHYLTQHVCAPDLAALVLQCIALHLLPGSDRSLEATLLRDAHGLDFLGVVGVLRDVSKNPRELRLAYEQIKKRRLTVPPMLHSERARAMAEKRIQEMDALLRQWETDSFGCF